MLDANTISATTSSSDKAEDNDISKDEDKVESKDEKKVDDNQEVTEIKTTDGKTLYLDENKKVYDMDAEGEGNLLGELLKVEDKTSPIVYGGEYCIVSKDMTIDDIMFKQCVYSNKLYKLQGKHYQKVGHIQKDKNGFSKPIFDKKK